MKQLSSLEGELPSCWETLQNPDASSRASDEADASRRGEPEVEAAEHTADRYVADRARPGKILALDRGEPAMRLAHLAFGLTLVRNHHDFADEGKPSGMAQFH